MKLSFRITASVACITRPAPGGVIDFLGKRLHTNKEGRTSITYRFHRRGIYKVIALKIGYRQANATITVRR